MHRHNGRQRETMKASTPRDFESLWRESLTGENSSSLVYPAFDVDAETPTNKFKTYGNTSNKAHQRRTTATAESSSTSEESTESTFTSLSSGQSVEHSEKNRHCCLSASQDSNGTSSHPSHVTDGGGHGSPRILGGPIYIPSDYTIKEIPKTLRASDNSTDYDGGEGISTTRNRRCQSAPRMRASERLLMRRLSGEIKEDTDHLIEFSQEIISGESEENLMAYLLQDKRHRRDGGHHNMYSSGDRGSDERGSRNDHNDKHNDKDLKHQRHKNATRREINHSSNNSKELLSDYIQLKLEVAELRSQLQHVQARLDKSYEKIEVLQSQNVLLEQENARLHVRNVALRAGNQRPSGWLGKIRRFSLPEEACHPWGNLYKVSRPEANRNHSCINTTLSLDTEADTRAPEVAALLQDFPSTSTRETKRGALDLHTFPTHKLKQQKQQSNEFTGDRPDVKDALVIRLVDSSQAAPAPESVGCNESATLAIPKSLSYPSPNIAQKGFVRAIRSASYVSTGETSFEPSSCPLTELSLPPIELASSVRDGQLCYSIQNDSLSSEYCEFSVLEGSL
eukprot:CCRYP_001530-RA/>CCRYP_001530-RA protein AED:0.00 eAED:0.00 QI:132/1/1/1/1/1/2/265/565